MVRPDRAGLAHTAPLEDLLIMLLRQYKRPLESQGVTLTSAETAALAQAAARGETDSPRAAEVRDALATLVQESIDVLAGWQLTFQTALATGMDAMPGWETTAEFLEIANQKSNAEIRIAAGATLLAALGDLRHAADVLYLATHDEHEVDSVIARRVLLCISSTDAGAPDWAARLRDWLASRRI